MLIDTYFESSPDFLFRLPWSQTSLGVKGEGLGESENSQMIHKIIPQKQNVTSRLYFALFLQKQAGELTAKYKLQQQTRFSFK